MFQHFSIDKLVGKRFARTWLNTRGNRARGGIRDTNLNDILHYQMVQHQLIE